MTYAEHFQTRVTPQSEKADPRQVPNSEGGFTFTIDHWKRLERFLILGAEGGSYYAAERKLTRDNAAALVACLDENGPRTVALIVQISDSGRAPKNDPAIFALAVAAAHKDPLTRRAALDALPMVCRIGTHLFQFLEAVKGCRGHGRGLRRGLARWYDLMDPEKLAYQVAKYQQRNGVSHRDVLRLAHPKQTDAKKAIYRWIVAGADALGPREVKRDRGARACQYEAVGELPAFLAAFEELKRCTDAKLAAAMIREHNFTHEMVPGELKAHAVVWEALAEKMPLGALVRNLAKLTAVGVIAPLGAETQRIAARLTDPVAIKRARLHPVAALSALTVYGQGHGEKGKLTWTPVEAITDALDQAFYLGFDAIEPTGKRTLLAIDISGSMDGGVIAGIPGLTPRLGAAAMAMVTARVESNWHAVGFSSGAPGEFVMGAAKSMHYGYRSGLTALNISPRQRLDDVVTTMRAVPMGGTDCALPMLYALEKKIPVDIFHVYTDSETWAGDIHPFQALKMYRDKMGIAAKLAVVAMVGNEFTIADPSDAGMMDFVGMDAAAPAVLADFARG